MEEKEKSEEGGKGGKGTMFHQQHSFMSECIYLWLLQMMRIVNVHHQTGHLHHLL